MMSKELKEIIESIDSANKAHSDLETMIRYLREEVQRLNFRVNEQKKIIQNQRSMINDPIQIESSEEVQILKDLVKTQRDEIIKKDKDIEILQENVTELTRSLEQLKNDAFLEGQINEKNKIIINLTEENEQLQDTIDSMREELTTFKQKSPIRDLEPPRDFHQDLIDAKKVIFQLTEELGINRVKFESLKIEKAKLLEEKSNLVKQVNELVENLNNTEEIINVLSDDLESSKDEIVSLQENINIATGKKEDLNLHVQQNLDLITCLNDKLYAITQQTEKLEDENSNYLKLIKDLREENDRFQNLLNKKDLSIKQLQDDLEQINVKRDFEVENLKKSIQIVEHEKEILENELQNADIVESTMMHLEQDYFNECQLYPESLNPILFGKMYYLLDNEAKGRLFEWLISNLEDTDPQKRRVAIKYLGLIDEDRVLEALEKMVHDNDWIAKLYLIKSLISFKNARVKEMLLTLSKDTDPDVREMANGFLQKMDA
jgi:chromosome segregation ATPase